MNQTTNSQAANIEAIYALSPLQEGILFHCLYEPHTGTYFEQLMFRLEGQLDRAALRQAWQLVIQRHPILRTLFVWEGRDKPLQVVRRQVALPWEELDWRAVPAAEQPGRLEAFLEADRVRGFDLGQAPLVRFTLIQLAEDRHQFVWSHNHLLLDGWSVALILNELFASYTAFSSQSTPQLEPSRPYREYIAWLGQQPSDGMERFWRQTLQGLTTTTPLPAGKPLPAATPGQAAGHHEQDFWLPATLTQGLQALARDHQLTLNTLIQGIWGLVLGHYSDLDDVLFGATVSGRSADIVGIEAMVGLFINTVPVRVRIPLQARLIPWLQQLQAQQVEARQYEYSSLSKIQGWSDIPNSQPLFESLLVFENYPLQRSEWTLNQQLRVCDIASFERSTYPLTAVAVPGPEMLLKLMYHQQRFDPAGIGALGRHFQALCEQIVANPDQCLGAFSLLGPAERATLLVDWNQTRRPYPGEQTLAALFAAQVARDPGAIALVQPALAPATTPAVLSYGELDARANQLAHYLQERGIGPDTLVAVCLDRSFDLVVALLGILKAGGAYLPLDPAYPHERLALMLADTQAPIILTQTDLALELPPSNAQVLCLDRAGPILAGYPTSTPCCAAGPDHLAYVIYTSGSTGRPKGVAVPQRAVIRLVSQTNYADFGPDQSFLLLAPISFDAATLELWGSLLHGSRLVIFPSRHPEPATIAQVVREQQVTTLWLTAGLFHLLVDSGISDLRGLRQLLAGGEALSVPHVQQALAALPATRLINGYGPTENTTFSCCYTVPRDGLPAETVPIGGPIGHSEAYVLNASWQPVPIGVAGELFVGGDGLARGYLNQPALTAARFVPHPFSAVPGARLYRTGDQVRWRADGVLEFLGRRDTQVKIRGFRIELDEIAHVLERYPAVASAVVLLRSDGPGEQQLVAYVVPATDSRDKVTRRPGDKVIEAAQEVTLSPLHPVTVSGAELRAFLKQRLPDYMLPAAYVALDRLPLTPNGKIDRKALPAPDAGGALADDRYVAPGNLIEKALAAIWGQLLGVERVGVQHSFFELGGHSLLATQLISWLRTTFQVDIALRELFEAATIAQLAPLLSKRETVPGKTDKIAQLLTQLEGMSIVDVKKALEAARLRTSRGNV